MSIMSSDIRNELFNVRMSAAEMKMLRDLADIAGVSAADIVRQLVRREHADKCNQLPQRPKQSRKGR